MSQVKEIQQTISKGLNVLDDDIQIVSEDTLTFYIPQNQLQDAEDLLDGELDILEEYEHEYLMRLETI